jgi:hypothetical protein
MMDEIIRFILSHVPAIMFVGAIFAAVLVRQPAHLPYRLLAWMLLLSVGVEGLWRGSSLFLRAIARSSVPIPGIDSVLISTEK